jgi:hypothetical protein
MKARPIEVTTSMAMVDLFRSQGLAFVPVPAIDQQDFERLLAVAQVALDTLIAKSEEAENHESV